MLQLIKEKLDSLSLTFTDKPIIIGGMAMEYYGLRKSGADIDLVITGHDYHMLEQLYPNNKKDIWGDLGFVINEFEIWRSISLFDYEFYSKDAIDCEHFKVVSLDRLLFMRVLAMDVEKYRRDLDLIKKYYYQTFRNADFLNNANLHFESYKSAPGGIILNEKY